MARLWLSALAAGALSALLLTVIATSVLIPFELYEIVHSPSWLKAAGLAVNVVIVVYLARLARRRPAENPA